MTCAAVRHNTTYAYDRFGCRCPEAVERRRHAWRVRYRPKGTFRYPRINGGVDPMAVERACGGDRDIRLTVAEMRAVIAQLSRQGRSAAQIAIRLGISPRTVQRYRTAMREAA